MGNALCNRTYQPVWLATLFVIGAFWFAEKQNRTIFEQDIRAQVQAEAGLIRSRLEGVLNADIQLVQGLVAVVATEPELTEARFSEIASHAIGDKPELLNVAVTQDLVVTMVHPYAANRSVLGLDLGKNDAQREAVFRMRDSGDMVLAGPVDLVQGGTGFIGRFPIFTQDESGARRFSGMVAAVIDAQWLYQATGIVAKTTSLDIALSGRDGTGETGAHFYGNDEIYAQSPIVTDIVLPTGSWSMAVVPRGGWPQRPDNLWMLRLILSCAGLAMIGPTFMACRLSAHRRQVIMELSWREQELESKQTELEQLSAVAQNASDSIILTDPNGRIIWTNDAFSQMTGFSAKEALGRTPGELLNGPESNPDVIRRIANHINRGQRYRTEILNYTKSGKKIWVDTHLVPVRDDKGKTRMIIGIERDITQSKIHEAELAEAKSVAETADRAKSEFLANMSHEIRTPMNGIIGMAELLADGDLGEEERQYVEIIRTSSKALLKIINDILDLSRLETGKMVLADVDFDLIPCIESAVDVLRPVAREKGLSLSVSYAADLPKRVRTDDGRLRQVLVNLIGNAVKFTSSGHVSLEVTCAGSDPYLLRFQVEDTGIGLTAAQIENIFERFSQADAATTRAFGGTGLGLTISRHLAEQMGGAIAVKSAAGQGSCFTLTLHCKEPQSDAVVAEVDHAPDLSRLEGCRILLAEDNRTNRLLIRKYLASLSVELIEAENGRQAVDLCLREAPDVVLMDMSMPEMDGVSATRAIRSCAISQPPIVALTANAFASDKEACLAAGMNGFLSKPVNKKQLLHSIVSVLDVGEEDRSIASI
ncbi:response regulator [Phaeobacter sp. HF9A]|nr:response regulator [Phaeobacter sp. HF9A]